MKPNFPAALLTALLALAAFPPQGRASLPQWYLDAGLPELDTDGDGIPDAWERRTFGDPGVFDSGLDRDRDGLTDLEEFILGTDPRTFSTAGDLWSDGEKVLAGLDPLARVTPAVTFAQWLPFTGWNAQEWRIQTATNEAGFAVSYAGFVYNTSPYSETNLHATVDFWLATRTDRPALLTVADALATNSFPVPPGNRRVRLRVAYGGEVALTLDPLPGTLAQLPGATNGVWLCGMTVEPAEPDTVVFASGETPATVEGDPPGVNGILIQSQPASPFPYLGGTAPRVSLLPLRVTNGARVLGDGYWCVCFSVPPCDWPNYGMIAGCCPGSVTVNGSAVGSNADPLMDKTAAYSLWLARQPCLDCTVTQTVASATYPFLYERVIFTFRPCMPRPAGVYGAEENGDTHEPEYVETTECGGIGGVCEDGPVWFVGFSHAKVNTRNLNHPDEDAADKNIHHCIGVVWDGQPINLTNLCEGCGLDLGTLAVWEANGERLPSSMLNPGVEPSDLEPTIFRVKMLQASNPGIVWDQIFIVVNNHNTKTLFDDWYTCFSVETNWLAELPAAYRSVNGPPITNFWGQVRMQDPEPPTTNLWANKVDQPGAYMHHLAKWQMRSTVTAHGHGNQACYDEQGQIILSGVSAGSADYGCADGYNPEHVKQDVDPFVRALQLDGNPSQRSLWNLTHALIFDGDNLHKYRDCRPAIPNDKPLLNPGGTPQ